jgi:type VI secretion system protein ImpB
MAGDSGQKFIQRNRPPRVQIQYEDPYDAERKIELPFVMGVLSDLSGPTPGVEKAEVADRAFLDIDMDNFGNRMAAIEPGTSLKVNNKLGDEAGEKLSMTLRFKKIEDFGSAGQSDALYGRQGRCRKPVKKIAERQGIDGGSQQKDD